MEESKAIPPATAIEDSAPQTGTPQDDPAAIERAAARVPRPSEWETVRHLAIKQLNRFMAIEPRVLRGDDPGAIHDLRVASRRLQQILDLLYPKPRTRSLRVLRRKMRRSRRCLSEIRNCDVMMERVEKTLAAKRVTRREARHALRNYLRERRGKSFERAIRKLGKINLAAFYLELRRYLNLPESATPAANHLRAMPALEFSAPIFHQRLAESLGRVWRAFDAQLDSSHSNPSPSVIHAARIATKRLRYLIEVIAAFSVAGSEESLAWLRLLQRRLGEWHDLEVLEQMMIEMVARPDFLREQLELAVGVEKLIALNRKAKKKLQERFFAMTMGSPEFERLKGWVAYLLSSPSAAFASA